MSYNQFLVLITVIFSIFILFTSVSVTIKKKYNFLIVNIVSYVFYLIFLITQYKLKFQVNPFIILSVLITIIGNNLVGEYLNFYNRSKYFDRYLHVFGSFSFSLFYYSIIDKIIMPVINSKIYIFIFVAALGISLGCLFEILEFILDSKANSKNQHGLKDTDFDLISDVIGSTIAGLVSVSIFI